MLIPVREVKQKTQPKPRPPIRFTGEQLERVVLEEQEWPREALGRLSLEARQRANERVNRHFVRILCEASPHDQRYAAMQELVRGYYMRGMITERDAEYWLSVAANS